ncbi:MAG: glycosyltransferase family 2 protein [Bacteroidota bacterium]
MSAPEVSFITVNYNGLSETIELIASIKQNAMGILFEIIVVDNASKEDPTDFFASKHPEVVFIRSDVNLGFAGGNNLGIQKSAGHFLFFVNNDTIITEGLTKSMISRFETDERLGMLSPKICFYNTKIIQYAGFEPLDHFARNCAIGNKHEDGPNYQSYHDTYSGHGAAMMLPRNVIDQVGLMPELYFLYYEELDWSCQVRNAGYRVAIDQSLIIYHKESMSVGKSSDLKTYYHFRNRILFVRRNFQSMQKAIALLYLTAVVFLKNYIFSLLKGNGQKANLYWKALYWNLTNQP